MMLKNRLKPLSALVLTALTVPLFVAGCSSDNPLSQAQAGLCCTKFVVGADMTGVDFGMTGQAEGQFVAFAEASSNLAAVASSSLNDVAAACEAIARDVGASADDINKVDAMTGDPTGKATAWCTLAANTINASFSATGSFGVTIGVDFQPPVCTASVSAQANCEAGCTVDGNCTADAMVSCTSGKLPTVECQGSCTLAAMQPTISCTGTCMGSCTGSCSAQANVAVDCTGKCDGDCTVDGMAGSASGVQADGTCKGKCNGTCTASGNAAVSCSGTCSGQCDAECDLAPGSAKFECNGSCTKTDGTPPKCEGSAKLDCNVSADCEANCQASVNASAQCTPPKVGITVSGTASADVQGQVDIAVASLEANLPQLLVVFQARGQAFLDGITATVKAGTNLSPGSLNGEAALCLVPIGSAIADASTNFTAAFGGAKSVVGAVGVSVGGT